jgi:hypothetical protein
MEEGRERERKRERRRLKYIIHLNGETRFRCKGELESKRVSPVKRVAPKRPVKTG